MAVSRSAVKQYLEQPIKNSDKVKKFTEDTLDIKLTFGLNPTPRFSTRPYAHQKACFLLGLKYPTYLFLLRMGLGKTKIVLDIINYRKRCRQVRRSLVLVPNTSNIEAWIEECKTHAPELIVKGVVGTPKERRGIIEGDSDICIVTYMGWLNLVCDKVKSQDKSKMRINEKRAKEYCQQFDMAIFDESTALKNHQSLTFKTCKRIMKFIPFRYALTGTPFGRDPQDLWSQFYIIDKGETFGLTLGIFRAAFFTEKINYWGGYEYTLKKSMKETLYRRMRNKSIVYTEDECLDLPAQIYSIRPVIFGEEMWAYYDKLIQELSDAQGNFQLMKSTFIRMRQLSSGFLAVKDLEGERIEVVFKDNPKVDALIDLIKEIPEDRKIIIWNEFVKSGEIICEALKKEKIKHVRLYGGTKNKSGVLTKFKTNDKCRVLVSSSSGAFGLNLQVANFVIFFESPTSPITRDQMEKRCHRTGQTRRVFYYDIPVKGSMDARILKYLQEGKDLYSALMKGDF